MRCSLAGILRLGAPDRGLLTQAVIFADALSQPQDASAHVDGSD